MSTRHSEQWEAPGLRLRRVQCRAPSRWLVPVLGWCCVLLVGEAAQAQSTGAAVGLLRRVVGAADGVPLHGVRLSVLHERPVGQHVRVQADVGFTQMTVRQTFPTGRGRVNQNAVDLALVAVRELPGRARVTGGVGAVVSRGVGCGTDGTLEAPPNVRCPEEGRGSGAVWAGVVALVRRAVPVSQTVELLPEVRWSGDALMLRVGVATK